MANDLNLCQFIGRLGADPETRYMQNGDPVANFRIACGWKTKEKEGTEWVSCVAYGKLAEIVSQHCRKGGQVYVSGRFRTRKWQDQNGNDRYTTEINIDNLQLLGSKPSSDTSGPSQHQREKQDGYAPAPDRQQRPKPSFDDLGDDIPF